MQQLLQNCQHAAISFPGNEAWVKQSHSIVPDLQTTEKTRNHKDAGERERDLY
jgi:hypothetical protein